MPPCPHFDLKIVQRSKRQSAVAAAAYQSGERLFSEYDQKQKYYSHKSEIVHTEIMLPPHAPPEYADRNTLWNAAEAIEKQWNSQLARRLVLAIPRDIPRSQQADLIRDYCREFFVSKGMIADFAIHDKGDGNPHAHILFTMRGMDEQGKWLPKSRKVYDLDENGERIRLASGNWKSHKEDTVDWNDQKYGEIWRQAWQDTANRYLEAIGSPERLELRSYERQGIDKIPTVHMGPAVSYLERKGIQTNIGNLNRDIKAANSLMQSIRQMVRSLKGWLSDLKEKKAALFKALEQAKEPTIPELLSRYLDKRSEERTGWTSKGKLKGTVGDFNKVMEALDFLRQKEISTVESLDAYLDKVSGEILSTKADMKKSERRIKAIDTTLTHLANHGAYGQWIGEKPPSAQQRVRWAIVEALGKKPADFPAFLRLMEESGFAVKHGRGGVISFLAPGQDKYTRLRASVLGPGFDPDDIRAVIAGERPIPEILKDGPAPPRRVNLIIDIQERMAQGKSPAYARWAKVYNLKQMAAALQYLQEHKLTDYEELAASTEAAVDRFHALAGELRETEAALSHTVQLMGATVDFAKTRPVFDGYKAARYSRKYLAQHEAELAAYRAAKAAMNDLLSGAKLPKIDALKKERRELSEKKKALYAEYRKAQADMRQAVAVKANIDYLLGHTDGRENKAQER